MSNIPLVAIGIWAFPTPVYVDGGDNASCWGWSGGQLANGDGAAYNASAGGYVSIGSCGYSTLPLSAVCQKYRNDGIA